MPEFPLDPDLAALSAALGGLTPMRAALSRDRLLYEAGRRAANRRPLTWPIVAGLFAVLSVGLGVRLMTAAPDIQVVYVEGASRGREPPENFVKPAENTVAQTPGAFAPGSPGVGYLGLRNLVVRFGADSLPTPTSGAPLIVSIQVRTGFISVYPVAPWNTGLPISPTNDPYAFAKDGRASGM